MKKRIVSILLAVCLTVGLCSTLATTASAYSTGHPNTHTNTGNQRADIVAIAETQLGYTEDPGTKYGAWWQEINKSSHNFTNEAWCVMFVHWCAGQAGATNVYKGLSALSSALLSKYQAGANGNTAYKFGSGYMPRPGDLIFVGKTYSDGTYYTNHVGLVVSVDNTTIYTIEGNYNNRVSRSSYSLETGLRKGSSSRSIVYFGVPAYTNDSTPGFDGPVIDSGTDEPDIPDTGINYKTTLLSNLNVRSDASISANVITSLPQGTEVTIVDEKADGTGRMWGRVSTGGWISLRYTSTGSTTTPAIPDETVIDPYDAIVNCDILLIRVVPGTSAATDNQLYRGNKVTITATATANELEWGKLSTGGWVATKYLSRLDGSTDEPAETPDEGESPDTPTEPETALFQGTIFAHTLNVREEPVTGTVVDLLRRDEVVDVYEVKDMNGKQWGRVSSGWISLSYVHYEYTTPTPETPETETPDTTPETPAGSVTCSVTGTLVNVRTGAGTTNGIMKTVPKGTSITIVETTTVGTSLWGKLSDGGWISINYTNYRDVAAQQPADPETPETPSTPVDGTNCTVTGSVVNVRAGAGTDHVISTTVKKGTVITIVETTTVGTSPWGRLSTGGWISLNFTDYSRVTAGQPSEPTTPETPSEPTTPSQPEEELPGGVSEADPETPEAPDTTAAGIAATVNAAALNVRQSAGYSSVVGTVRRGESVTILETKKVEDKLWGRISLGWISMDYVTTTSTGSAGLTYTVTAGINVRSGAGTSNAVIGSIGSGSSVTIVSMTNGSDGKLWGQLASGGWISMDYTTN